MLYNRYANEKSALFLKNNGTFSNQMSMLPKKT